MSYTHSHIELVKTITGFIDDRDILNVFEHQYRESLVSDSFEQLLTGVIPTAVRTTALTNALQAAADEAQERYTTTKDAKFLRMAASLWNPITANLVQSLKVFSDVSRAPDLPSKDESKSQAPDKKPRLRGSNPPRDTARIQQHILHYLEEHPSPYRETKHIACSAAKCDFCIALFKSINLTKCSGHKPCVPSKWFPHVGPPLWKMLKKSHDKNLSYHAKRKEPSDDEIASPWSKSTKIASSVADNPVKPQKIPPSKVKSAVADSPPVKRVATECSLTIPSGEPESDDSEGVLRPKKHPRTSSKCDLDLDESSIASSVSAIGTGILSPINWADEDPDTMT